MATMDVAAMDTPGTFPPESPLDQDDVIYPCKGCGEVSYTMQNMGLRC